MKCEYCGRGEPGNPVCPALFEHFDDYGAGTIDKAATVRAVEDCRAAIRARALRAEAELRAMQAEAEKWARVGWRNVPEQDAAIATGCNRAAEAILAAKEQDR
jgi:hypothetical protein